jgi:hypothetical protein
VFVYWEFSLRLAPGPSPFLQCTFSVPSLSAVVVDYSLLFVIHFFAGESQSAQWLCWFTPGLAEGISCDAWCWPICSVWSWQLWWWWEPHLVGY